MLYHSYALSSDSAIPGPWYRAFFGSRGKNLGTWCINGFLVLSGFMLNRSADSGSNGGLRAACAFAMKRLIRIYPGILFVTLVAVFVVGPAFTTQNVRDYFGDSGTWAYLFTGLNVFARPPVALPGVFDANAFRQIVNGNLWMIPWLMWCYILFAAAILLRLHRQRIVVALMWVLALYGCSIEQVIDPAVTFCGLWAHDGLRLMGSFVTGWALYLFRDRIRFDGRFALAMLVMTPFWLDSDAHTATSCLLSGYVLCTFCFHVRSIPLTERIPRIHWEIFLLSFMVQQGVTAVNGGGMPQMPNFIYSLAITIPFALILHSLLDRTSQAIRSQLLPLLERP